MPKKQKKAEPQYTINLPAEEFDQLFQFINTAEIPDKVEIIEREGECIEVSKPRRFPVCAIINAVDEPIICIGQVTFRRDNVE